MNKIILLLIICFFCEAGNAQEFNLDTAIRKLSLQDYYGLGASLSMNARWIPLKRPHPTYKTFDEFKRNFPYIFSSRWMKRIDYINSKGPSIVHDYVKVFSLYDEIESYCNSKEFSSRSNKEREEIRVFLYLNYRKIVIGYLVALSEIEELTVGNQSDFSEVRNKIFEKLNFLFLATTGRYEDLTNFLFQYYYLSLHNFPIDDVSDAISTLDGLLLKIHDVREKKSLQHFIHGLMLYSFQYSYETREKGNFRKFIDLKKSFSLSLLKYFKIMGTDENKIMLYKHVINEFPEELTYLERMQIKSLLLDDYSKNRKVNVFLFCVMKMKIFYVDYILISLFFLIMYLHSLSKFLKNKNKKSTLKKALEEHFHLVWFSDKELGVSFRISTYLVVLYLGAWWSDLGLTTAYLK